MMDLQSNPVNEILYVSFNQDFTCFVCGTETGFRVYSTDPFRLTHRRDFENGGGLGVISMLFRTNILAFAGGGRSPHFQPHKVVLWDDRQSRVIADLSFRSSVKSVRLHRDLVVCTLNNKVFVYAFRSLRLVDSIETTNNPKGLCCLAVGVERVVLVCPGAQQGTALVIVYPRSFTAVNAPATRQRTTIIAAHSSALAAMSLDNSGTLLATASDKGTILRVFETASGSRLQELRRGADRAEIHSITFSPQGEWMAVSSDKGTVHVFAVRRAAEGGSTESGAAANATSSLQRLSGVLPAYFSSEWSLAKFRVPDYRCIAAFGQDPHTVVIVCANGSYYKARFDPVRGGEMVREEYEQFDNAAPEGERWGPTGERRAQVPSARPEEPAAAAGPARSAASSSPPDPPQTAAAQAEDAAPTETAARRELPG